ncbi:MAG: TOMM precursor leader peptide-binding protein [Arachnia sp.]
MATESATAAAGSELRPAPGLDATDVGDDLLLTTPVTSLRLDGGVASVVRDRILPLVAEGRSRQEVVDGFSSDVAGDVAGVLDVLVRSGVLVEVENGRVVPAWTHLISASADERTALAERAAALTVGIVGSGDTVDGLARSLTEAGIGTVLMRDVRDEESAIVLVADCDFVVTVVAPELSATRVWVNAASLAADIPSLHAAIIGTRAEVGPLVLPGEGPCYLCWRMRALACASDFTTAMAREEALDRVRRAPDTARPVLPHLVPSVVSALCREVLAATLAVFPPRLAGGVLAIDGIVPKETLHPVLPRPDCEACRKKGPRPSQGLPTLDELADQPDAITDFDGIVQRSVSPLAGLIRVLERIPKDVEEPEIPIIVRSELANARFLSGKAGFIGCSGKAMTPSVARDGAVGEALERYASLTWDPPTRFRGARSELSGASLDPRDLVLFAEDQYENLPYSAYRDETVLDWVPARSLVTDEAVWVPLVGTHLGYDVPHHGDHLFAATSNGFAAGANLRDAVLAGLLEVVERDAFLIAWAHRLPGRRSPAASVPDEDVRRIADSYARRGVRIDVHRLPTDAAACVVMAVGWSEEAPAVVVGLGAGMDPVRAARGAVLEVGQVRPALRARLRHPATAEHLRELVVDPGSVRDLEDHDLLYADPATADSALGYLLQAPLQPWDEPGAAASTGPHETAMELRKLVDSLAAVAGDVLYTNVTTNDVASLGVSVARALVPGFQPIHFGADEWRLGGRRLYQVPRAVGLAPTVAARTDLNLAPHPLA